MTTKITATFNDGDELTVRTLNLPHDVTDRVGELIGLGLLAEHTVECDAFDVEVHRGGGSTSPACESDYQVGDTVDVSPSCAWAAGGRGTVVELDDDEDSFTPICVECEGLRWWVSAGCVKRVESSKVASVRDFYINDVVKVVSAYDVKLVGRQGRVILLRPQPEGVLVQFGVTEPDVWLSPDDIKPAPEKVAPELPLHSTREAMREAGLPNWEMGKGLSAADAIRELARQRDEARLRLREHEVGGDEYARLRWRDAIRDAVEMLSRVRRDPGRQTAYEIEELIARCRGALEDA